MNNNIKKQIQVSQKVSKKHQLKYLRTGPPKFSNRLEHKRTRTFQF